MPCIDPPRSARRAQAAGVCLAWVLNCALLRGLVDRLVDRLVRPLVYLLVHRSGRLCPPLLLVTLWAAGCSAPALAPVPAAAPQPVTVTAAAPRPATPPQAAAPVAAEMRVLPPAQAARNWDEFQLQAAQRLVLANPGRIYLSAVPDALLAIPVLEVELSEDGQVRHIRVKRMPTQATDTVQLAKDAVHRAAPYGSMKHLDKPWTFIEVFLFDDDRRFKPRTLDQ